VSASVPPPHKAVKQFPLKPEVIHGFRDGLCTQMLRDWFGSPWTTRHLSMSAVVSIVYELQPIDEGRR